MSDNTEQHITANVLQSLEQTADPRLKTVLTSLISHLHAFIREVDLTEAEWLQGIQFLTRTGQICDDKRQEFMLLSDTLGVTILVDAINHRALQGETESTVLGPFHREGAEELPFGASISKDGRGQPVVIEGRVLAPDGTPIVGATLDVWETSENGLYEEQDPEQPDMNLRGIFRTDGAGRYKIVAIKPVSYSIPDDGPVGGMMRASGRSLFRPAHIHFIVAAPGYAAVTTHLFVQGDPYLASDAVFGTKDSLVVDFVRNESVEAAAAHGVRAPFYSVEYEFVLKPAASR
ncbi:MAG TPA: intradiol ring-cleavage dioxygenase [Roseiflexaceae bacterium]|nr:intradiol ring-cleavage dioxygenase [Roseiflexaceae bacterium]